MAASLYGRTALADDHVIALDAGQFAARFETDNPGAAAVDAAVDARAADVTEASQWFNPSLSYEREEVFPDGGAAAENTLTLGWRVDVSGRRTRRRSAARAAVGAARARAELDKLSALTAALDQFYDAAYARLVAETLRDGRAPLARMVEALRARVKAGDAAGYDLARLELELASYDEQIAEAETELRAARRGLGGLLGEPSALYDADDSLALPVARGGGAELASAALADRGDYRAAGLELAAADASLSAARRGWVPVLDLGIGLRIADLGTETATGYVAMIGIELPLFSRAQAAAERARAERRGARARRAQLERSIPTAVRIAAERLDAAVAQARRFRTEQLDRARALVGKAESIYQSGEGSVVELVDAYRTAVRAQLRALVLLRRARAAELALSLALGRRPEVGAP